MRLTRVFAQFGGSNPSCSCKAMFVKCSPKTYLRLSSWSVLQSFKVPYCNSQSDRKSYPFSMSPHSRFNSTAASAREIRKFDNLANEWWDESGPFKALHSFNSVRVPWIVDNVNSIVDSDQPLKGLKLLEIGCGGGILTEPLCRLGADVTAIDLSAQSVAVAESRLDHAGNHLVKQNVTYMLASAEELAENEEKKESFDAVVMSEVIEHNENPQALIKVCESLLKPEGKLFITTLNKTLISYLFGIVTAEYVLKIVPPGTHEHDMFVRPEDLKLMLSSSGLQVLNCRGLIYNPVCNTWTWSDYFDAINYACVAGKTATNGENIEEVK